MKLVKGNNCWSLKCITEAHSANVCSPVVGTIFRGYANFGTWNLTGQNVYLEMGPCGYRILSNSWLILSVSWRLECEEPLNICHMPFSPLSKLLYHSFFNKNALNPLRSWEEINNYSFKWFLFSVLSQKLEKGITK